MLKHEKEYQKYQDKLEELAAQKKKIKNDDRLSEKGKEVKVNELREQANSLKQRYQEEYKQAIDQDIENTKAKLRDKEIPEQLREVSDLIDNELEFKELANEYEDANYWTKKKLAKISEKNEFKVNVEVPDLKGEINQLQRKKKRINKKFSRDPFNDTEQAKLNKAFGLN